MDDLPELSDDQLDLFKKVKSTTLRHAENARVQVRRRLNPANIQSFVDKERAAAVGLAGGAFVGLML